MTSSIVAAMSKKRRMPDGWTARTQDFDVMVAMDLQTYAKDIAEVKSGGYVIYDSTWPLADAIKRAGKVDTAAIRDALATTNNAETAAIDKRLRAMTGATVELQVQVDPALIGGLTVRIGDRLIDASVRGRLEPLRHQLTSGARAHGALGS